MTSGKIFLKRKLSQKTLIQNQSSCLLSPFSQNFFMLRCCIVQWRKEPKRVSISINRLPLTSPNHACISRQLRLHYANFVKQIRTLDDSLSFSSYHAEKIIAIMQWDNRVWWYKKKYILGIWIRFEARSVEQHGFGNKFVRTEFIILLQQPTTESIRNTTGPRLTLSWPVEGIWIF